MYFSRLPAHILLIALSITRHASVLFSIQLGDIYLQSEYPSVLSYALQSGHGPSPWGIGSIVSVCRAIQNSICLSAKIHVCFTLAPPTPQGPRYPVQALPISYLNRSENTPLHPNSHIKAK